MERRTFLKSVGVSTAAALVGVPARSRTAAAAGGDAGRKVRLERGASGHFMMDGTLDTAIGAPAQLISDGTAAIESGSKVNGAVRKSSSSRG